MMTEAEISRYDRHVQRDTWTKIRAAVWAWAHEDFAAAVEAGERMEMPDEGMTYTEVVQKYFPTRGDPLDEKTDERIVIILPRPGV